MITVAVANRNANTGASTTTPGIVDHMAQIGRRSEFLAMRRSLRRADGQPRSPGEIPDLAGQISVIGTLTGFGIDNAHL
jgi:hypothetical protein